MIYLARSELAGEGCREAGYNLDIAHERPIYMHYRWRQNLLNCNRVAYLVHRNGPRLFI